MGCINENNDGVRKYQGDSEYYMNCLLKGRYCQSIKGIAPTVVTDDKELLRLLMKQKMEEEVSK